MALTELQIGSSLIGAWRSSGGAGLLLDVDPLQPTASLAATVSPPIKSEVAANENE